MVDQSDLPFRVLCRRHGTNLCYTPMIHSRMFLTDTKYRAKFLPLILACDGPLFFQFCCSEPDVALQSMQLLLSLLPADLDYSRFAVDINCGCPQGIARRGSYGAFLLEQRELLLSIVRTLTSNLPIRVTIKVRILPSGLEDSIALYKELVDAGVSLLCLHGRTRHQKGQLTGAVNWDAIRDVVAAIGQRVPVMANGGIANLDDVRRCLDHTKALGVMSSEGLLEYPALFSETNTLATDGRRVGPSRCELAREYVAISEVYPTEKNGQGSGHKCVRTHLQKFLYGILQDSPHLRDLMNVAVTAEDMNAVIDACEVEQAKRGLDSKDEDLAWYLRHRCEKEGETKLDLPQIELVDDFSECGCGMWGDDGVEASGDY
jgi:tRNA-dihydrouridine synthase 1